MTRSLRCLLLSLLSLSAFAHADQWTPPTPEELSMTAQPEVPGAPAVYLFREEKTEDKLHMYSVYVRLKVLSEGGKKFGDIEVKYNAGTAVGFTVAEIAGRTIQPDGSVVPFTGKPYDKLIVKTRTNKYMAKVFSMPDVRVGSIIEYRYDVRYEDNWYVPPQWYVQSELFTRKAHYIWRPTDRQLTNARGQITNRVSWTQVLPDNAKIVQTELPVAAIGSSSRLLFELTVNDVPPVPNEDYMPPISSLSYRVLFYYSPYSNGAEFWKEEGKFWAKDQDRFIGPGSAVTSAVHELIGPADTNEQKLRKLYNTVQQFDNTRFSRDHSESEDKAQGFREIRNTDDILLRKRGNDDQLTDLFVAMARAAGFKASVMRVSDRSRRIFFPAFLSLDQLDDNIAIVNVAGTDVYLDPGTKFCPYGQLDWKHTMTAGLRQVDGGAAIMQTPQERYSDSRVQRVANLTMDKEGVATGTVKMTYMGAPAITWRQRSLEGDDESLKREFRTSVEELLPRTLEIKVDHIEDLNDFNKPLTVVFNVKGTPGASTGKRLILPADLFEANETAAFPHEKREVGVYFEYGRMIQDAIRINFPPVFAVESVPTGAQLQFQTYAKYNLSAESAPTSITTRRNYVLGNVIYIPSEYPALRSFYSSMEAKDQQSAVLKLTSSANDKAGAEPAESAPQTPQPTSTP